MRDSGRLVPACYSINFDFKKLQAKHGYYISINYNNLSALLFNYLFTIIFKNHFISCLLSIQNNVVASFDISNKKLIKSISFRNIWCTVWNYIIKTKTMRINLQKSRAYPLDNIPIQSNAYISVFINVLSKNLILRHFLNIGLPV